MQVSTKTFEQRLARLAAASVGIVLASTAGILSPSLASESATSASWTPYPGPAPAAGLNAVNDVRAVSESLAWSVGQAGKSRLLLKWDGVAWTEATVTPEPTGKSGLSAVHTVSASSAWAVGWSGAGPWVIRYRNGAWAPFPVVGLPGGALAGIATTAKGIPVVVTRGGYSSRAKVAKWNGSSWSVGSLPIRKSDYPSSVATAIRYVPGSGDAFVVVGSESATNAAWAVRGRPGRTWENFSPRPTVTPPSGPSFVFTHDVAHDVHVASGSDVTLVGASVTTSDVVGPAPAQRPYVTRWNGSRWVQQKFAVIDGDAINAIAVQPGKSRLLVGFNNQSYRAIAYEYTATTGWKRLPSRPEGTSLYGAGAIPGTTGYWGVGSEGSVQESELLFPYYADESAYLLRR